MGVSDDLKIVSGEVMPADLREKLKALVEEMRERAGSPAENRYVRLNLYWYADKLEALLAESEPEPCARCGRTDCDGGCRARAPFVRISRDDVARVFGHRCDSPTCPACKSQPEPATLKLGHPYGGCGLGDCGRTVDGDCPCYIRGCGQPREAH